MESRLENMEKDLISVLIPAYNVQKYLGRCLRSILRQTYKNLEVVVVDDGSTDNTYQVAKQYADADQRVILLQKQNEGNVSKARNFLLDHCHGKYCVWVDSDDCVKPAYVEKLYRALIDENADMSVCRFAVRAFPFPVASLLRTSVHVYQGDQMIQQIIYRTAFMLWNKMYRVDLIREHDEIRFDPNYCYGEDLLFNLVYLKYCKKIACVNSRLYSYSWRAGSEMHKKFSENHVNFMNRLLELCESETNLAVRDTLRGWAAFSCCGSVFLANKRAFPDAVARMKQSAFIYRKDLYKNHLAKPSLKCILWLGLKTWCRPKKTRKLKLERN